MLGLEKYFKDCFEIQQVLDLNDYLKIVFEKKPRGATGSGKCWPCSTFFLSVIKIQSLGTVLPYCLTVVNRRILSAFSHPIYEHFSLELNPFLFFFAKRLNTLLYSLFFSFFSSASFHNIIRLTLSERLDGKVEYLF